MAGFTVRQSAREAGGVSLRATNSGRSPNEGRHRQVRAQSSASDAERRRHSPFVRRARLVRGEDGVPARRAGRTKGVAVRRAPRVRQATPRGVALRPRCRHRRRPASVVEQASAHTGRSGAAGDTPLGRRSRLARRRRRRGAGTKGRVPQASPKAPASPAPCVGCRTGVGAHRTFRGRLRRIARPEAGAWASEADAEIAAGSERLRSWSAATYAGVDHAQCVCVERAESTA